MHVTVLSKEIIKPSSPTPSDLRTFQLSLFDQLSFVKYTPIVFFYPLEKTGDLYHKNAISTLKKSLSETLSLFYLLAGRIIDRSIHCNDEGALYLEASVDCSISDLLKEPNFEKLIKLLPCHPSSTEPIEEYPQIFAQLNTFNCGGIAIAVSFLHKLIDATTMSNFLRSWASINRGSFDASPKVACFDYKSLSSLFPQTEFLPFHPRIGSAISDKKRCFERFVFDAKAISHLKGKAKSIDVPNPTRVEVVTSFIWKYVMEAESVRSSSRKASQLNHVTSLRNRIIPPLPDFSIGNIFWLAQTQCETNKDSVELDELVNLVRDSFLEINNDYIQNLIRLGNEGNGDVLIFYELIKETLCKTLSAVTFSSWRNMNFNNVDFGWGKPIWVSIAAEPSNLREGNTVFLLDTTSGDGVEAWIVLDEEEMKLLKQNPKFLEFALINPSIPLP